ncbi:hypothetical protein [Sporosarcina sp. A2]|uniref:hypothetical protein n=1 Tax=Sporosarcina sp. A2 TaxID=3393449 RepID=UPI003D7B21A6
MTIQDGTYPNKHDLEPKVKKQGKVARPTDELPLSDPADSNFTQEFRENEHDETGEQTPSIFTENEQNTSERTQNDKAHKEWNDSKPTT